MNKTLNKAELKQKIEARRAELARQKRLAEARQRVAKKPVLENRPISPRSTLRKPVVTETRAALRKPVVRETRTAVRKPVVTETVLSNRFKKPETLTETIARRNKINRIPVGQQKLYNTLAENIANYAQARKSLTENFNAAGQARGSGAISGAAGLGMVHTFFDIFYGFFPQLVAPHLASVQPLKTEQGYIFYMEYVAGSDKGSISKGTVLVDPFQVSSQNEYTSDLVTLGTVKTNASAGALTLESDAWAPVKKVFANGTEIATGAEVGGATITLTVGSTVKAEFSKAPSLDVVITYTYDNVFVPTEVPLLVPNVIRIPIAAKYRTIKTNHAFQAAYGYEAEHGDKLGSILADAAMEQLKREVDLDVLFNVWSAAESKVVWNKAAGVAVGGYQEHKLSLKDAIAQAANLIFKRSKRVRGNVLVVGVDVLTIIETLPGFSGVELGEQLPGAAVVGKLGKMPVIASPDVPAAEWLVLYKGTKDNFDAGIVFAPYLPVFATEPAILDDFIIRQAFITAYALKVVNKHYFVKGEVINNPVALPIYLVNKNGVVGDEALDFGTIGTSTLDIFGEE